MSQPGGRVSGFPSRYRTYLRCSPLICLADMLSIMIRLMVYATYLRLPIRESVGILLHHRFEDDNQVEDAGSRSGVLRAESNDDGDGEDGIQTLERMTWLRWLWFLLGTLPPSIKLASMRGVGWAQTWGMIFLASWVMNELLIIFATFNQSFFTMSNSGRITWPGYEQATRSAKYKQVQQYLDYLDHGFGLAALAIHVVVMNSIFRIMSRPLYSHYTVTARIMAETYVSAWFVWMVSTIVWVPIGLISFGMKRNNTCRKVTGILLTGLFFIMIGNLSGNALAFGRSSISSVFVWGMASVAMSVFMLLARYCGGQFSIMGRNLLVVYRNNDGRLSIDYNACLALFFFLSTVGTSLFWYGKMYDPSGTSVPVWTGIFG